VASYLADKSALARAHHPPVAARLEPLFLIRELRQRASELLRLVEKGETIEITDRGRPVALLAPLPEGSALERMRAAGEVESATAAMDDLPEPVVLPEGVEMPSAVLERLRRHER